MKSINLKKVKNLRESKGLSQKYMSELLGHKTLYTYHRKESGKQPFTAEEMNCIAIFFGVTIEYFFDHKVAKNAI